MALTKQKKEEIISDFANKPKSTGDAAVQVALLTERINYLTEHMKSNKKDFSSKRGLLKLVARRKKLLEYLHRKNPGEYKKTISKLGLRK